MKQASMGLWPVGINWGEDWNIYSLYLKAEKVLKVFIKIAFLLEILDFMQKL